MSRILTLSGDIDEESIKDIITSIQSWNLYDDEQDKKQKDFKKEIIHLMINSSGGYAYDGFGLATMIKSSKTPIYTYGIGKSMSSGFIIFLGGHKRFCYEGSTFLYHQMSQSTYSKLNNFKRLVDWDIKFQKRVDDFVVDRTKITMKQLTEINNRNNDWYISSDEALELGIVNEIIK